MLSWEFPQRMKPWCLRATLEVASCRSLLLLLRTWPTRSSTNLNPAFLPDTYCRGGRQGPEIVSGQRRCRERSCFWAGIVGPRGSQDWPDHACIWSELEHVETMNSGSFLNILDSATRSGSRNGFSGWETSRAFLPLEGALSILSCDSSPRGSHGVTRQWRPVSCVLWGPCPVFMPLRP